MGYNKDKFDFDYDKTPDILISNVYEDYNVMYQVNDLTTVPSLDSKVVYGDAITKETEEIVARMFPFSKGEPHWVISLLLENNNIDDVEKVIQFYNAGGEMLHGKEDMKQSHQQRVSFMTIHDICITAMQQ